MSSRSKRALRTGCLVWLAASVLACHGDAKPPDARMNPPGTSWWCSSASPATCRRGRLECEELTKGSCSEQSVAYCWTYDYGITKQHQWMCAPERDACLRQRAGSRSRFSKPTSACGRWGPRSLELAPPERSEIPDGEGWWCGTGRRGIEASAVCARAKIEKLENWTWKRADRAYCFVGDETALCTFTLAACEEQVSKILRVGGHSTGCGTFD